ncbi:hypothetical protein KAR91_86335 [Candidatus Pacearchaeota archaeon]|nr:hypothetical protein [Candidatus Pacearchaeota archaeon]
MEKLIIEVGEGINSVVVKEGNNQLDRVIKLEFDVDSGLKAEVTSTSTGGKESVNTLLRHGFEVKHIHLEEGKDPKVMIRNGPIDPLDRAWDDALYEIDKEIIKDMKRDEKT